MYSKYKGIRLLNFDCLNEINVESFENVLPNFVMDNLYDYILLNKKEASGYIKQYEYIIVSSYICNKLGMKPVPQVIFSTKLEFDYDFYKLINTIKIKNYEEF